MINIKKFLKENSDLHYADFNRKFITSNYLIMGVRIPLLRKFAKEIEPEYIELEKAPSHEEILLYGFSAANYKTENEQLEYLQNILPYIDNWCSCDCIVANLKKLKGENSYTAFLDLLKNKKEFYVRVGIVGLMRFFINSTKIEEIVKSILEIKHEAYYVKMAEAWFFAELCSVNFALAYENIAKINDKFIRNKSISKARESFRISKENKILLLQLKI